jgi:signal transduction histidine kinase
LHLINEVLDLARIESGRITLEPRRTEPTTIAAECVDSLRSMAAENNIAVVLEARPVGNVWLDPARLRQILLNYLSNAIKVTPADGTVSLAVRRELKELVIEVTDTGPGIEPADQERLFVEFEQLNRRGAGGTGLGLALTKGIVEAQHGSVGIRSVPGHGSTFFARLPITIPSSEPEPPPAEPAAALASPVASG